MPHSESHSAIVLELAEEFLERHRQGQRPPLKEYLDKHPELADEIREVFPAMAMMEQIALADESIAGGPTGADTAAPSAPPPRQLGDFRILREVGRGGMGVVYEAEQVSLGRHVALKLLPPQMLRGAKQRRRFEREARVAAKLHHTNIVPVFGVGEHEGTPYYVMQFIRGQGLDEVLGELKRMHAGGVAPASTLAAEGSRASRRDGSAADVARSLLTGRFEPGPGSDGTDPGRELEDTSLDHTPPPTVDEPATTPPAAAGGPTADASPSLPSSRSILVKDSGTDGGVSKVGKSTYWQGVTRIGVQAAEALEYAHKQRILHRDIKPSNLLLDTQGTVWVADFGLAKADDHQDLTDTGDLLGTLRYMPPEAFEGGADARDARGDLYSLGLTLYELLAFRPAFDEKQRGKLIRQVTEGAPTPLRKINPEVPRDLETIVQKAIAKEPARRYATAGELAEDLKRFLDDRPIRARPVGPLERTWRWCKRNPPLAGAVGLAASALIAAALLALLYADRTARYADRTARHAVALKDALNRSHRLLAIRNFDRGQTAFEKDQIGPGLHWMVESWRSAAAAGDPVWQHAASANLAAWRPQYLQLRAALSHAGPVEAVAFSRDGKTILTGGADKLARFWDVATGRPIGQPLSHQAAVSSVMFSPDGTTILTGSRDGTARLWDAATGRPIGHTMRHAGAIHVAVFSPDGKSLLTGGNDRTARLWEAATGRPLIPPLPHLGDVYAVAFSPDGRTILTGGGADSSSHLWDAATGRHIRQALHPNFVQSVAFSPDGKTYLVGENNGAAWLTDVATGKPCLEPLRHQGPVKAVAFSPDGKTIFTGSTDKTARLWEAATGQPLGRPIISPGQVTAASFGPDGKTLLTASYDGTARLWDTELHQPLRLSMEHQDAVSAVAFSFDGRLIATGCRDGTARLWEAATGLPTGPPLRHADGVRAVAFSPDGKSLLTGSGPVSHVRGEARLWDVATGRPIGPPLVHRGSVLSVAFSPDGKTFLTSSRDGTARLWDAATGRPLTPPLPSPHWVLSVAFSPDGKTFLVGDQSGGAQLWDAARRTPLGPPFMHPGVVGAAVFSPDSTAVLTGCNDGLARLWDLRTRTQRVSFAHQGSIFAVAFSPDGKTALTGSRDRTARLWDVGTGVPLGPPLVHRGSESVKDSRFVGHATALRRDRDAALFCRDPGPFQPAITLESLWARSEMSSSGS